MPQRAIITDNIEKSCVDKIKRKLFSEFLKKDTIFLGRLYGERK
jgi:hypothetical protein